MNSTPRLLPFAPLVLRKLLRVLQREGWPGLRRRLRNTLAKQPVVPRWLIGSRGGDRVTAQLELSQGRTIHGLFGAQVRLLGQDFRGRLRLLHNGQDIFSQACDTSQPLIPLKIHSHLLPNGKQDLIFEICDERNKTQWRESLTVEVLNEGHLAQGVRDSLRRNEVPTVFSGPCDSSLYDYSDEELRPWFDQPDAQATITAWHQAGRIDEDQALRLRQFVDDGYMIIEDCLPDELIQRVNHDIDKATRSGYSGYTHGSSMRLEQMHTLWPGIRELWLHDAIHRELEQIFQEESRPCQSLVYVFGSQQAAHQDTIHLTPFPQGYMCGVWIALEDVRPGSGELEIYPGSHRLPRITMAQAGCDKVRAHDYREFGRTVEPLWLELIQNAGIDPLPYRPRKGTVLIWHENLLHAGSPRQQPELSRRSIVTHNFARGAIAYYDSTGQIGYSISRQDA